MICNNQSGTPVQDQAMANEAVTDAAVTGYQTQLKDAGFNGLLVKKVCYTFQIVLVDISTGQEVDPEDIDQYSV